MRITATDLDSIVLDLISSLWDFQGTKAREKNSQTHLEYGALCKWLKFLKTQWHVTDIK